LELLLQFRLRLNRMTSKIKIGAVSYLNTRPLVYRLAEFAPTAEIVFDLPSRLADYLAAGRLDVALIPSIEYFQTSGYTVVSDACIACRGPVLSVKLFSRVPVSQVRTLALDEGSRTSAALVQILLNERAGIRPQCQPLPIGATISDTNADAVLLIGDRAIHSPAGRFAEVWDLGDEWRRWSGLPFVFAMWVARSEIDVREVETALSSARDCGVANLEQIAATEAAPLGLTTPQCLAYLRDNLHFYFGAQERRGLDLFYRNATELNLAPQRAAFSAA
jgi:chorismate dehydratase